MISASDAFAPIRKALEDAGCAYAIGGSWASTAFGEPRFTQDVDVLAAFTRSSLRDFLAALPPIYAVDADYAQSALANGRPFNVIHMGSAYKFDFFPAAAFPLGLQELERATTVEASGLSLDPVPFVTPEDILIAKLHWYRSGGEVSEVQWRDILGLMRNCGANLDWVYLEQSAATVEVDDLLSTAKEQALGK